MSSFYLDYRQQRPAIQGDLEASQEGDFLAWLSQEVERRLQQGPEAFLAQCYRLDIPEVELSTYLSQGINPDTARAIAQLILRREREKAASRALYQGKFEPEDEDEAW